MDEEDQNKVMFFGRNISEIPCFKSSFTYGIMGGLGLGFANFMLTSRIKRSTDIAMYSFSLITFCYWCVCRYQWSKQRFEYQKMKTVMDEMQRNALTNDEPLEKLDTKSV